MELYKDFTILNVKQNKSTLPSELVHYIYSYINTYELKKTINSNYICNSIKRQLYNNKCWRLGIEDIFILLNVIEKITIDIKNIPYPNITTFERLFWNIQDLVEYKKYSYLKFFKDEKYWGESYQDRKMDGTSNTENTLIIKLYSNDLT